MRVLLTLTAVVLMCFGISTFAATQPGTIVTITADASYSDAAGTTTLGNTSNASNILVVSAKPGRPVMLTLKSLFCGPSTVGRTVKLFGRTSVDADGTWISDGSVLATKDSSGKTVATKLRCKLSTVFLSSAPTQDQPYIVTGISQVDATGTPVIIPSTDAEMQSAAP